MRRKGNIMLVAPAEELAAREKIELEAAKTVVDLEPLRTELIVVSYAKASEIAALLKSEGNSLLTERGSVTVDERTNTLLINETGGKLADIRKLVTKLDIPIRQVLIESRVVIADDSFSKDLGVKFGINGVDTNSNGDVFTASSKSFVSGAMLNSGSVTSALLSGDNRMNVNMPVIGNAGTFAFGFLGSNELLDLELTALKTEGRGEVVSSPRVITSNKNTATIEQGTEIPYATVSDSGTQIEFKKAVLSLQVTPQITPDDRIALDLRVTKDSPGETAGGIPPINTKRVETQVLVDNGQTVVLGGVYEQTIREDIAKVPFFGDLPLIGFLFTNKHNEDEKNELLIFVTPKILKEGVSTFDQ
jgi:type IV pilus assembly protein PilQ